MPGGRFGRAARTLDPRARDQVAVGVFDRRQRDVVELARVQAAGLALVDVERLVVGAEHPVPDEVTEPLPAARGSQTDLVAGRDPDPIARSDLLPLQHADELGEVRREDALLLTHGARVVDDEQDVGRTLERHHRRAVLELGIALVGDLTGRRLVVPRGRRATLRDDEAARSTTAAHQHQARHQRPPRDRPEAHRHFLKTTVEGGARRTPWGD
jgi:hypothetical protein